MTDTTAKIRSKGLETTGVTEELANEMWSNVGRHYMAIVEVRVEEPHGPTADGKRRIDLVLTQVEPAQSDKLDDTLRELQRAMYRDRRAKDGETLPGTEAAGGMSLADAVGHANAQIDTTSGGTWDGNTDAPTPPKAGEPQAHLFLPGTTDPKKCAIAGCTKGPRSPIHVVKSQRPDTEPQGMTPEEARAALGGDGEDRPQATAVETVADPWAADYPQGPAAAEQG